jgi:hypothetical protein
MKTKRTRFTMSKGILACMLFLALFVALGPTLSYGDPYRLEDFLILVDDQLIIKGYAEVYSGLGGIGTGGIPRRSDIASRNIAVIGGTGPTTIPREAPVLKDVAVIAPNLQLKNFRRLSHIIYDTKTDTCTSGCVGPGLSEGPPDPGVPDVCTNSLNTTGGTNCLPDFPAFPVMPDPFPAVGGSTTDVICPASGSVDIYPDDIAGNPTPYRDLIINAYCTVNFHRAHDINNIDPSIFNFRRIIANYASRYNLAFADPDIQINVAEFVRLAEYGNINPTQEKGITIYVKGLDGTYPGTISGIDRRNRNQLGVLRAVGQFPAAFEYDGDGQVILCFVFVKDGTINLRGKSHPAPWRTQWFGDSFQEISSLNISLGHPGEICFQLQKDCACITDFKKLDDGRLRIKGFNFSTKTVERLAIFTENHSEILKDVKIGDAGADVLAANTNLTTTFADVFVTTNPVVLPNGKYLLGIMYPPSGDKEGYCMFTEKLLEIP